MSRPLPSTVAAATASSSTSQWSPLHQQVFRILWITTLIANIATWMQSVGSVWLMTSLSSSPIFIALMQTASSLPVFFVGLPAGALADIIDHRRLLLLTQSWIVGTTAILSILTWLNLMNPWLLLVFTFALGLGTIASGPAWQAVNIELLPPEEVTAAVTLNSLSFNLARAVGPAVGGLLIAGFGPGPVFLLNAACFAGILYALSTWHPRPHKNLLPSERMFGAMRVCVRYSLNSPELHAVLIRTLAFILFVSALWSLLPIVVRHLHAGSYGYGLLLACAGVGAVLGALFLPQIRHKFPVDLLIILGTLTLAGVMASFVFFPNLLLLCGIMALGGVAWLALVSSFNIAAQAAAPAWVRARALGLYLLVFQGGTALGSVGWGLVVNSIRLNQALLYAASGAVIALVTAIPWHLATLEGLDLSLWHTSEPKVLLEPSYEDGPIMVIVDYTIDPQQAPAFAHALFELKRVRQKDGSIRWSLFQDPAHPERHVESFLAESWVEHLRQLDRMTNADRAVFDYARSFHLGEEPPVVRTLVAHHPPKKRFVPDLLNKAAQEIEAIEKDVEEQLRRKM